jgi:imidazolonepropionase-like amidohydrolase
MHVRVIDGTGAPARQDQTIIIERGRIREIGDAPNMLTDVTQTLDLAGDTALPGLVGMHDHLFYSLPPNGAQEREMAASFSKLYVAAGVTSIRTAGAVDLRADILLKQQIDLGREIGPHMYLSAYVDGNLNVPENPSGLAQTTERFIAGGIRSIKAYTQIRRSELAAIVDSAHRRGASVTGHLCAIGFSEAAAAGIDNLEHGLIVDTEFYSGKRPGVCPDPTSVASELVRMDVRGAQIQGLIRTLVARRVAVTSTLAVFETFSAQRMSRLDSRTVPMLPSEMQPLYLAKQAELARSGDVLWEGMLKKEMEFEYEFVRAGGLLLAGIDSTGWGGVLAGFGDQRELELLVEAGFRPEQAIQIATFNGALFLGQAERFGTLAAGKQADIILVRGDPSSDIRNIEKMEMVIKDGIAYDPAAILRGIAGQVGRQ